MVSDHNDIDLQELALVKEPKCVPRAQHRL